MMRTRLVLSAGVLVGLAGAIVAAVALAWLTKNDGFSPELVLTGNQFKMFAMARAGLQAGVIAFAIGMVTAALGFRTRPRATR